MSLAKLRSVLHQHELTKIISSANLGNMTDVVVSNNHTAIGIAQGYHFQTQRIPVVCIHKPEMFWTIPSFPSIVFQINPTNMTNGPSAHIRSDNEIDSAVRELKSISTAYQTRTYLYLYIPNNIREIHNIIPPDDAIIIQSNRGLAFAIGVSSETHKTVIILQNEITDDIRYMHMARNLIHIITCRSNSDKIKKYYDMVYVITDQNEIDSVIIKCKIGKYAILV